MISRSISQFVLEMAESYPIVTIIGPRQSGKTTLAKFLFPKYDYVSLEDIDVRDEARSDMRAFLARHPAPAIFDEIQRVPELANYLQTIVDERGENGMYVLTGSHQPILRATISQSLAGRTGLVDLLPLSIQELKAAGYSKTRERWMLDGFMPRVTNVKIAPYQIYRDYFRTYIERDSRQLINLQHYEAFEKFIRLLAGRVGQVLNLASLGNELGISATTLKKWLKVLEASYIIWILKPYYNNFGKRIVKSPKVYFTEIGLLTYLLGIRTEEQMVRDPLIGNIFENMVVCEILKSRLNRGESPDMYYFRDNAGLEIDVLLEEGRSLQPIEIKSGMTFHADFAKNIRKLQRVMPNLIKPQVVYAGKNIINEGDISFVNFESLK